MSLDPSDGPALPRPALPQPALPRPPRKIVQTQPLPKSPPPAADSDQHDWPVRCPCGQKYRVSRDMSGNPFKCPACGKVTLVGSTVRTVPNAGPVPPPFAHPTKSIPEATIVGIERGWRDKRLWIGVGVALLALAFIALVVVMLRPSLGTIRINVRGGGDDVEIRLDDQVVALADFAQPVQLAAGDHMLSFRGAAIEPQTRDFSVLAGTNDELAIDLVTVQPVPVDGGGAGGGSQPPLAVDESEQGKLAAAAHGVLKKYCFKCHGLGREGGFTGVLTHAALLGGGRVTPFKLDDSSIWQRAGEDGGMPPEDEPAPGEADKAALRDWILAGAPPFPAEAVRGKRTEKDDLLAIRDHLRRTPPQHRAFQRYFTLTNLHNNSFAQRNGTYNGNVGENELRVARAALSKLVNSLSWKEGIVVPKALDADEAVLRIDLRDLDWDRGELWKEVIKLYPYGLKHDQQVDEDFRQVAKEVYQLSTSEVPYVRADWFIATASRPPLYGKLLKLPDTLAGLEKLLEVDTKENFLKDKLHRAGFTVSGVSQNNRLVERHATAYGAYWKSYDFATSEGTGNLMQRPLGPLFDKHPFEKQAFAADGGEMIFNLPNGLQGYFLTNAKGESIDKGPIDIVEDISRFSGSTTVVNGISCFGCHQAGMRRFTDAVRSGHALGGEARLKVLQLYPERPQMNDLLLEDERRSLVAMQKAVGSFLPLDNKPETLAAVTEPITLVAGLYNKDLEIDDVAAELALADVDKLAVRLSNSKFIGLGLGPLTQRSAIKRANWASLLNPKTLFHETAEELDLGRPVLAQVQKPSPDDVAIAPPATQTQPTQTNPSAAGTKAPPVAPGKPLDEKPTASPDAANPPTNLPPPELLADGPPPSGPGVKLPKEIKTRRQFVREQRLPGQKLPPAKVSLLNAQDKTLLVRIVDRLQGQPAIEQYVTGNSQVQAVLNCVSPGVVERHYLITEPDGTQRDDVQVAPEADESLYLIEVFVPAEEFGRLSPREGKGPVFRQGFKRLGEFEIGLNDLQPNKTNRLDIVRRCSEQR